MKKVVLIAALLFVYNEVMAQYIISTVAGNGTVGITGDGGAATAATMGMSSQINADTAGNLYVVDNSYNSIRKITKATGIITTIAGQRSLSVGYSGDGGAATAAELNNPNGVAVNNAGDVFISDGSNNVIRRVDHVTGIITTVAGGGTSQYGSGEPATATQLYNPTGMAFDKHGNLFVADLSNHVIRRVNHDSTWIVAGTGNYGFSGDGGPATAADLSNPWQVYVDSNNNIYIADEAALRIRKVSATTHTITTIAGNGTTTTIGNGNGVPATSQGIGELYNLWADDAGNVYFPDFSYNVVRKIDAVTNIEHTIAGMFAAAGSFSGDGGPATAANLYLPRGIWGDKNGNIYIGDEANARIRELRICYSPVAAFSASNSGSVVSFTYTGTTTGVDSVRWRFGDGGTSAATNPVHSYAVSGTYAACVTAYTNCDSDMHCSNIVVIPTAVNTIYGMGSKVYPNPVRDELHITGGQLYTRYSLMSVTGMMVQEGELHGADNTIAVDHVAAGIYLLELYGDKSERMKVKVVKE